jgi:hypothetical protein
MSDLLKSPINYKMEIKRAVVRGLQLVFKDESTYFPGHKSSELLTKSHITIEYPQRPEQYPTLIVGFKEKEIKSAGIGHYELDSQNTAFQRWLFQGTITLEIFALTSMDRDFISDSVINLLSFGRIEGFPFREYVENNANVDLQLSLGSISPVQESTMSGVSWGITDQRIYTMEYDFGCMGAFTSTNRYYDYVGNVDYNITGPWEEISIQI